MDQKQQILLEKNANALKTLFSLGQATMKPVGWAADATRHIVSPITSLAGKTVRGAGNLAGKAFDHIGMPLISGGAKLGAKAVAGVTTPIAGAVAEGGKIIGRNVVKPGVDMLSGAMKRSPVGTTLGLGFGALGAKDIYTRAANRPFYGSPQNLDSYQQLKQQYTKVGQDMTSEQKQKLEKVAGALGAVKKAVGYGNPNAPSLLGALGIGGLTLAASPILVPTLSEWGARLNRNINPLDARINAEEEAAKKQLGIVAAHQMDQMLGQHDALGRSFQAVPKLESNLQYIVDNDPIVAAMITQDPSKIDGLRETMNTVYDFAPDIAVNRQAAQSILRESAMSPDGGLNYNTIKLIADAQKSITGGR